MTTLAPAPVPGHVAWRSHVGIPVRNLWTLLVYAHDLAQFVGRYDTKADDSADLPELLARLLILVVERRLRRNLSRAYRRRTEDLTRVRGRIDLLRTETAQLLDRGRVACRFDALTADTPRNRLVRAALDRCAAGVREQALASECRSLSGAMERLGVARVLASRSELVKDQIARHDAEDRLLVTVATLALEQVLPGETAGHDRAEALNRDERLLRNIFEKAIAGFYRHELDGRDGWRVRPGICLGWQVAEQTPGAPALLPGMQTDIVIERGSKRLVIDTKFTGILKPGRFGADKLKSGYLYQLYSYLRSQEGLDARADEASGLLLHPALDHTVDESVLIQGHRLQFATVDLAVPPIVWREQLLRLTESLAARPLGQEQVQLSLPRL